MYTDDTDALKKREWTCFKYNHEGYISIVSPKNLSVVIKSNNRSNTTDFYTSGGWNIFIDHFTTFHSAMYVVEQYDLDGILSREALELFISLQAKAVIYDLVQNDPARIRASALIKLFDFMIGNTDGHGEMIDIVVTNNNVREHVMALTEKLMSDGFRIDQDTGLQQITEIPTASR